MVWNGGVRLIYLVDRQSTKQRSMTCQRQHVDAGCAGADGADALVFVDLRLDPN